jgi:hypothetical protein
MNANERKCFCCCDPEMSTVDAISLEQHYCSANIKKIAFICVHLRDAQGCANAAMQRPPGMAEGRATQEQLPRCARAAQFAFSVSFS